MTSKNPIVAKALNAKATNATLAKNAKFIDKHNHIDIAKLRESTRNSEITSTNPIVQTALNAKAQNAVVTNSFVKKQFGNVWAYSHKDYELNGITIDGISHRAEGKTPKDCVASARAMLAEYEKAVAGIKNAIAWMSAL